MTRLWQEWLRTEGAIVTFVPIFRQLSLSLEAVKFSRHLQEKRRFWTTNIRVSLPAARFGFF